MKPNRNQLFVSFGDCYASVTNCPRSGLMPAFESDEASEQKHLKKISIRKAGLKNFAFNRHLLFAVRASFGLVSTGEQGEIRLSFLRVQILVGCRVRRSGGAVSLCSTIAVSQPGFAWLHYCNRRSQSGLFVSVLAERFRPVRAED